MVAIGQNGHGAWRERYDHIDEHLSGRSGRARTQLKEWKYPDEPDKEDPQDSSWVPATDADDDTQVDDTPSEDTLNNRSDVQRSNGPTLPLVRSSALKRPREVEEAPPSKRQKLFEIWHCVSRFTLNPTQKIDVPAFQA